MSVVLITGSCGLVGSESALFFSKKGFDIVGIDNNARKFFLVKMVISHGLNKSLKKRLKSTIILILTSGTTSH